MSIKKRFVQGTRYKVQGTRYKVQGTLILFSFYNYDNWL